MRSPSLLLAAATAAAAAAAAVVVSDFTMLLTAAPHLFLGILTHVELVFTFFLLLLVLFSTIVACSGLS